MLRFIVFIAVIFLILSLEIFSQNQGYNVPSRKKKEEIPEIVFIPDFEFLFSFAYHTSSAYFDNNKKMITELPDSLVNPGITRFYTFDLKRYSFDFNLKYFMTKNISLQAQAPITIYNLKETYREFIDNVNQIVYEKELKDEFTHTRIDYIGLTANYALFDDSFINKYFMEVRIPTGNHDGVFTDNREFWSDGALEISPGFLVGTSSDKATVEFGARYNYRAEDMTDRLIGNLNFALHTVPGTRFYGTIEGAYNINGENDNEVFDIRKMPWQDEYLDAGFGFKIVILQKYVGDFSYKIRLDGRNSWNQATYFITFGLRF